MSGLLLVAVILITAALLFYTTGVWAERVKGTLRPWHSVMFALGFASDLSGTLVMTRIASTQAAGTSSLGSALTVVMAITGTAALVLMGVHLIAAIVVLARSRAPELAWFHRASIVVWSIWLVPFIAGAVSANVH
ncbi:MAG: HsmA family protein [Actinomycetota bacterium]